MNADEVIQELGLQPLAQEGGYFLQNYSSATGMSAIYYLITRDSSSALHRLTCDEIFHFYAGDPVEMTLLFPDGTVKSEILGSDLPAHQRPQVVVPRGVWQTSKLLLDSARWALLGTTCSPAFEWKHFELGNRDEILKQYPAAKNLI